MRDKDMAENIPIQTGCISLVLRDRGREGTTHHFFLRTINTFQLTSILSDHTFFHPGVASLRSTRLGNVMLFNMGLFCLKCIFFFLN